MPQYQRTEEQKEILSFFNKSTDSISINAVAGSGKTATVEDLISSYVDDGGQPGDCMYVVFNRANKLEAEQRMPQGVRCTTVNALGYSALRQFHSKPFVLDKNKSYKIADLLGIKPMREKFPDFTRALSLARINGIVPSDEDVPVIGKGLTPDSLQSWKSILDSGLSFGTYTLDEAITLLRSALLISIQFSFGEHPSTKGTQVIDFDDQLYLPVCFGGLWPTPKNLFVDEAQDMSPINHEMIALSLSAQSRLIMVGDPYQAMYGFRGAHQNSFDAMQERFDTTALTLSINFRSDHAIIKEAQALVPQISPGPAALTGMVNHQDGWETTDFEPGDVILCRNTKPLVLLFYKCLEHKLPAQILGADMGRTLSALIKRVVKKTDKEHEASTAIDRWVRFEYDKAAEFRMKHRMDTVASQGRILHIILGQCGSDSPQAHMLQAVKSMFSDYVAPICLSTIHKAKGKEWDRVFFLDPQLIPSKFATEPHELQQEQNIKYVGVTRAKHELLYIKSDNIY